MVKIDDKLVKKIADLAKLDLSKEEVRIYKEQMASVLEYIDKIKNVDVQNTEYISHLFDYEGERLREDKSEASLEDKNVFLNATEGRKKDDFFAISKVL
ncbi:Asp-tRNA(Asn)/Glu-tRNA(Gln) amidotransferase subunit GatC [Candidatus Dojkabacteria bacterium]|nr:Asp-tRNA(Asn)/Glu-tRNA(Gln) amidotransferase subunit GatC [Candidatus Dojkabacteria bacterium]